MRKLLFCIGLFISISAYAQKFTDNHGNQCLSIRTDTLKEGCCYYVYTLYLQEDLMFDLDYAILDSYNTISKVEQGYIIYTWYYQNKLGTMWYKQELN